MLPGAVLTRRPGLPKLAVKATDSSPTKGGAGSSEFGPIDYSSPRPPESVMSVDDRDDACSEMGTEIQDGDSVQVPLLDWQGVRVRLTGGAAATRARVHARTMCVHERARDARRHETPLAPLSRPSGHCTRTPAQRAGDGGSEE